MSPFSGIIPIVVLFTSLYIHRFNGRKEILRMDLVQFIYAFVITPTIIIWVKTFLFVNLKSEIGISLSSEDRFIF